MTSKITKTTVVTFAPIEYLVKLGISVFPVHMAEVNSFSHFFSFVAMCDLVHDGDYACYMLSANSIWNILLNMSDALQCSSPGINHISEKNFPDMSR